MEEKLQDNWPTCDWCGRKLVDFSLELVEPDYDENLRICESCMKMVISIIEREAPGIISRSLKNAKELVSCKTRITGYDELEEEAKDQCSK